MPPLPEALTHVSTDPAAEVLYVPLPFGQLVVIPPPFDVALPLLTQLLTALGLAPSYWFLLPLAGAAWTLSASELWAVAQRVIRPWASGRVNAAVIMLSQGAMAAGSMVWGLLAHTYGTRPTLAVVAALFAAYLALTAQRNRPLNERLFAGKKNE
jgi:hypothetical protein